MRLWSEHNQSGDNTTRVDAEYLEVIATRRGSVARNRWLSASRKARRVLAAFVEGLSEEEWRKPVSERDRRSVGVVVHHVATVYPIEIDLARAIAGGNAVTEVTWEVVSGLNAQHAQEQAGVTREATLDLLKRNSREAAAAVRGFTDEELDRAAPFSFELRRPGYGAIRDRGSCIAAQLASSGEDSQSAGEVKNHHRDTEHRGERPCLLCALCVSVVPDPDFAQLQRERSQS